MQKMLLFFILTLLFGTSLGIWIHLGSISYSIILIGIGIILLGVEMFLIPGVFFFGISGLFCVAGGLLWAIQDHLFETHLVWVLVSLGLEGIGVLCLFYFLTRSKSFRQVMLTETSPQGGLQEKLKHTELLGRQGFCLTELRPAGKIDVQGIYYDVVSTGSFINKGEKVEIVDISSNRIMVDKLEE